MDACLPLGKKRSRGRSTKGSGDPINLRVGTPIAIRRPATHPDRQRLIEVRGRSLEAVVRLGPCLLTSRRGLGLLRIGGMLPDTLASGWIGLSVEDVFDHPLLRAQGWTVDRIDRTAPPGASSTLVFATGQEPVILPWGG